MEERNTTFTSVPSTEESHDRNSKWNLGAGTREGMEEKYSWLVPCGLFPVAHLFSLLSDSTLDHSS